MGGNISRVCSPSTHSYYTNCFTFGKNEQSFADYVTWERSLQFRVDCDLYTVVTNSAYSFMVAIRVGKILSSGKFISGKRFTVHVCLRARSHHHRKCLYVYHILEYMRIVSRR